MKRLVVKKSSVWIPACAGIGLIGNELSNPLFVWCQFQIAPTLSFLGSDSAGLSVLFDERIDGRAADRVLENEVFDGAPPLHEISEYVLVNQANKASA